MDSRQVSRPPSVDSVHLGSTYSGFYPMVPNNNNNNIGTPHIPNSNPAGVHYSATNPFHQSYNPYGSNNLTPVGHPTAPPPATTPVPMQYANAPGYYYTPQQQQQQQQQQQLPPTNYGVPASLNLSPSAQIAAAASAAAAIAFQTQKQQQQITSPQQQLPNGQPGMYPGAGMMYGPAQQMPRMPPGQYPGMFPQNVGIDPQYLTQYYREYYANFYRQVQHQQAVTSQQKTRATMKFTRPHAHGSFSGNANQLVINGGGGNRIVSFYLLRDLFIDQLYPNLFLHTLLNNNIGVGDDEKRSKTLLPINDPSVALEWIRIKLLNDGAINYELKLILKVIQMLYKQNGTISSLDLSELLIELVNVAPAATAATSPPQSNNWGNNNNNNNNNSEQYLSLNVDGYEQMSQAGSDSMVASSLGSREQTLDRYRQLLMRGQPAMAITLAENNGLFEHVFILSYLLSYNQNGGSSNNGLGQEKVLASIRKFINTKLSATDPVYVLYSHLLQLAVSNVGTSTVSATTSSVSSAKIDSLEAFIIILANNIQFDRVEIVNNSYRHLIDLIVALLKGNYDHVLSDELFREPYECLLVNECLEFARHNGRNYNPRLLLRKLEFAFELFDFGFAGPALAYSELIRGQLESPSLKVRQLAGQTTSSATMYTSKLAKMLLPADLVATATAPADGQEDEEAKQRIRDIWNNEILKLTTRLDRSIIVFETIVNRTAKLGIEPKDNTIEEVEEEVEEDGGEEEEEASISMNASQQKIANNKNVAPQNAEPEPVAVTPSEEVSSSSPSYGSSSINSTPVKMRYPTEDAYDQQQQQFNQDIPREIDEDQLVEQQHYQQPPPPPQQQYRQPSPPPQQQYQQPSPPPQQHYQQSPPPPPPQQQQEVIDGPYQSYSSPPPAPLATFDFANLNGAPEPRRSSIENANSDNVVNKPAFNFFVPPSVPLSSPGDEGTSGPPPAFDFMSMGQVTSIPTFDLHEPKEKTAADTGYDQQQQQQHSLSNAVEPSKESKESMATSTNGSNKSGGANGGLFNSIFAKLKPKNQMILPDDTEPSLVYDPVSKSWVDKTKGPEESTGANSSSPPFGPPVGGPAGGPPMSGPGGPPKVPFAGGNPYVNNRASRTRMAYRKP